jgi:drug/metabolite transporter (DMT)-like permease
MLSDETNPDALRGPALLVAVLFTGYTALSVLGIVLVKRWLPEAASDVSNGRWATGAVLWAGTGAFSYIASFLLWMGLITRAPISVAYPVAVGATMCLTLVAGVLLFDERPTALQLFGGAFVLVGIALIGSGLHR